MVCDMPKRRKIDIRPILGAAVVFLIIGAIVFAALYFAIIKPGADALEASKLSAQNTVSTLSAFGNSVAVSDANTYSTQIQSAGSQSEVSSIVSSVNTAIQREEARNTALEQANLATDGVYFTGTTDTSKTYSSLLDTLRTTMTNDINAKTTKTDIEAYDINTQATTKWREVMNGVVTALAENRVSFTSSNSLPYGRFMTQTEAAEYIGANDWQTLRKVKFEPATVEVPVLDTLQRTPSIKEGSNVKVFLYDSTSDNVHTLFDNAVVKYAVYSKADLGSIAWTIADGLVTNTYTLDAWETLKAAAAGDTDAGGISLANFGETVVNNGLAANILDYTVSVVYVIEVSDPIAEQIVLAEFHQTATKDIILVPSV